MSDHGRIITKHNYFSLSTDFTQKFDFEGYFTSLNTKYVGQNLLFLEETTSTMDIIKPHTETNGFTVVANVQNSGRGRSSNKWVCIYCKAANSQQWD